MEVDAKLPTLQKRAVLLGTERLHFERALLIGVLLFSLSSILIPIAMAECWLWVVYPSVRK